ncbi:carbonic anhydrase [Methylocystis parvus]|uniref:Carbonic anhydrase n=1 Tax=Methylocystis parvus TaxID=134 RepID=A0A6B8M449_9HYPH|nr:carbonic anhydrase [Methylocystis parvus]QGM96193.1 carbonic anhydrase [Methylocystis parvus]WBJ99981.1 carbonic anhydrase [Methylocystis parvus OBBP]
MRSHEKLLLENKAWAEEVKLREPDYFERLARGQQPEFLWIGCADSRVPADIIVNAEPGLIFAHRNIANQVIATDFNCLSVVQYAVQALEVKHVIVCGHYSCGGIKAALSRQNPDFTLLNKWLLHVKDVYRLHRAELDAIEDPDARADRLVELNVIEQANHLAQTSIIQGAWKRERRPLVHGWVYALDDGLLKQLVTLGPDTKMDSIYETD